MTTTFTWSIPENGVMTQTVDGQENTVVLVQYLVTATDGVNTAQKFGTTRLTLDSAATFIPFADLTEAQVLTWVNAEMSKREVAEIQAQLIRQLERMANPPVRPTPQPLPWATGTPPNILTCVQA